MAYEKKVLVLKQTESELCSFSKRLSGIARIETENGVAEFHLSLINLPKDITGEYYALIIFANKKSYSFRLGARPSGFSGVFNEYPDLNGGLAVGVYAVKDDIPLTLAFARADGFNFNLTDFKKLVAEKCLADRRRDQKKEEPSPSENDNPFSPYPTPEPSPIKPPYPPAPSPDPNVTPPDEFNRSKLIAGYDDEAVATLNYFELEESIEQKLETVKENTRGNLPFENELPFSAGKKETLEKFANAYRTEDETDLRFGKKDAKGNYFQSVKAELDGVLCSHEQEKSLMKIFLDSTFVKVFYSKDKFYVVGVIKENGKEKYVCYGVPATYSPTPPKELNGYCSFIPLSIFNMKGEGYWMMFQDAESGKCIHIETV